MITGLAKVGRWEIERHLASGGMAEVYLARDPASGERVALKVPHDGEEIWEAERTGARLQIELSNRDPRVPRVFEIGEGEERFVAMEYVEGEDLSRRLQAGPIDWPEAAAVAIELCGVLATARSCAAVQGEPGGIVHGDIKPRNIRVQDDGRIKVLDFGIAKALRRTRAETRNFYGSVPYSSPERLDRGHVDYHSDLWSVAVVLYEMLEGRRPFQAASEPELERAIRSGARPAPLERPLPPAFQAVLDRALAPSLADRYESAQELEADLRAALRGDLDATRRTTPATNGTADLEATRRTRVPAPPAADSDTTRRTIAARPRPGLLARARRVPWRLVLALVVVALAVREASALAAASRLRASLASRPRGEAGAVWAESQRVIRGHPLVAISGLGGAVRDWMVGHADDLISRYRSDTPTLYETGWRAAESLLQKAANLDPGDRRVQARLEYCRGHLLRIAARDALPGSESMSRYDEAASRFQRAARLWPSWGDPHVGLAQIYAYAKRDPDRTSDELERAHDAHYPMGERETALLGDAYRLRAEHRWAASTDGFDDDQRYRHYERTRDDCAKALEQYELVPSFPGVPRNVRALRQRIAALDARMHEISGGPGSVLDWLFSPGGGS